MNYLLIISILITIFYSFFLYILVKALFQVFFGYGVPFIRTKDFKIKKLVENIKIKSGQNFLDLGSGDGKVLEEIEKNFKGVNIFGIENSYFPYKRSLIRKKKNNLNYTIYKNDYFKENFEKYDVIYTYMIPYLMDKIRKKIKSECKKGTLFYSNSFEVKGEKEYKKIKTKDKNNIYVYKV